MLGLGGHEVCDLRHSLPSIRTPDSMYAAGLQHMHESRRNCGATPETTSTCSPSAVPQPQLLAECALTTTTEDEVYIRFRAFIECSGPDATHPIGDHCVWQAPRECTHNGDQTTWQFAGLPPRPAPRHPLTSSGQQRR